VRPPLKRQLEHGSPVASAPTSNRSVATPLFLRRGRLLAGCRQRWQSGDGRLHVASLVVRGACVDRTQWVARGAVLGLTTSARRRPSCHRTSAARRIPAFHGTNKPVLL
jgi:hypothetical protein